MKAEDLMDIPIRCRLVLRAHPKKTVVVGTLEVELEGVPNSGDLVLLGSVILHAQELVPTDLFEKMRVDQILTGGGELVTVADVLKQQPSKKWRDVNAYWRPREVSDDNCR